MPGEYLPITRGLHHSSHQGSSSVLSPFKALFFFFLFSYLCCFFHPTPRCCSHYRPHGLSCMCEPSHEMGLTARRQSVLLPLWPLMIRTAWQEILLGASQAKDNVPDLLLRVKALSLTTCATCPRSSHGPLLDPPLIVLFRGRVGISDLVCSTGHGFLP